MLEVRNLSIKTRHLVFDDVSYTFEKGKLYGIVAVNGSGKTTLFRGLTGLIPTIQGSVLVEGMPVSRNRRRVFYYESFEWLDGNLSGMDYLVFVRDMWHSSVQIDEITALWDMDEYIRVPIRKYSLGMKQRLIIAMYLVADAEYMIMDEITNGLDEKNRSLLFQTLRSLCAENKMILISSHYKEDIQELCDVMLTIDSQKLREV